MDETTSTTSSRGSKNSKDRLRTRRRRQDRRLLSEALEQRQMMFGPELIGIQPNEGSLLVDNTLLSVSPRELVFRFDDNANIDPSTLSAIQITRAGEDGAFESASAVSDLGTGGSVLVEFRAVQTGSLGNGLQVAFSASPRTGSSLPIITVAGNVVNVNVNSNPSQPTRVQDLITGLRTNAAAAALVEAIQVSGPSQGNVGTRIVPGTTLTLIGANAAEGATDFGTNGAVRVRVVSELPGAAGRGTRVEFVRRDFGGQANPVVVVSGQTVRVELNSNAAFPSTAGDFINAINTNPDASALVTAVLQEGSAARAIGNGVSAIAPLTLSGVTDVVIEPGFVGLGDSPREVVFRFAEPLPDDLYQIDILGSGAFALRNVDGQLFQGGDDLSRRFEINLGPKVVAVVPEPVRRNASGGLDPSPGIIEVHFNEDDLNPSLATNPSFYQLVFTRDTATNRDDVVVPLTIAPIYNSLTNIVTLNYGRPLSRIPDPANPGQFLGGAVRLRVGTSEGLAAPPTVVPLVPGTDAAGDTFASAFNLDGQWTVSPTRTSSVRLTSEIFNTDVFDLDLPGPNVPGTRQIRPDDPSRLTRTVPLDFLRLGADSVNGISVIQYDFAPSWIGDDPTRPGIAEDRTYFNLISEQQRQRVREVMSLFSEYLGVSFVEVEGGPTSTAAFSIAVGDLYGTVTDISNANLQSEDGGLAVATRDRNGDGVADLGVLDFQDFDESIDDQFGDEFFRGAMFTVGQLLGYGYADSLPQPVTQSNDFIFAPGTDNEPAFPSVADIVNGQFLYRPDSTDIDLYRFTLTSSGSLSIETLAERLASPSLLDTTLRLYRLGSDGNFVEIAQNDDYFSNDSAIQIDNLSAGTYMIGVSARGNNDYDPSIEGSGFGGLTEGQYELSVTFEPIATSGIRDTTGQLLDGDNDNRAGGAFDFWFVPGDSNNTLYVDKAASATGISNGSASNPFREIDLAIAAARPGDTIRVVGNGGIDGRVETLVDNFSYQVGFAQNGLPLADGSTLNLPQGVRLVIDSGAVIKLSGARIGVGSVSPLINASDSSLQVLGTPTIIGANGLPARDATNQIIPGSVYFTSLNDNTIGIGNMVPSVRPVRPGDWGGIDFRGDLDTADESRRNREDEGVFLNHIQFADIRFGGGAVSIGGRSVVVSPIDIAVTRPTIINSRISQSADAAISATPDTFTETRFTEPSFQAGGIFTPDYSRVGPEIAGNVIVDNSINGLFIRVVTRTGDVLETVTQSARFDDTDIVHVLTENLVIQGTPGGAILQSSAPSSLAIRLQTVAVGSVPAGVYTYRVTNVDSAGLESAASQPTVLITTNATGAIRLSQLPTAGAGSDFVSRRLYRASVDPITGIPGDFRLVGQLNASDTSFVDRVAAGTTLLSTASEVLRSRLDASLVIDPGTVLKIDGARIEARFGANLIAEGLPSLPIVFTSLEDQRYGAGGTFDTNERGDSGEINPGDWGGIYIGAASSANIDQAVIAGAGGTTRIEGGFASFNAIEVQQGNLRLANTRFEQNADGRGEINGSRVGRTENGAATVFVRASQPVIVNNVFVDNEAAALSFDINSLNDVEIRDPGRATGLADIVNVVGNSGPFIQGNVLDGNGINGLLVRGGQLATAGVWDDVDIVHVVDSSIEIPNQFVFGGLRLQSDARGSLVVKFESAENETAGIVVGGSLASAADQFVDIADRIGGSLQLIGHADFPVILTALADDTAGAGFTLAGLPQLDTNNNGLFGATLSEASNDGLVRIPFGPEVNNGLTIDNDVDVNTPGFFEATLGAGNQLNFGGSGVTVQDLGNNQVLVDQNFVFQYSTFIDVPTGVLNLAATTITQPPTLIADDTVESRGTFVGPNGTVSWVATSFFLNGTTRLFSRLDLDGGAAALGDVRVISYLDEDVDAVDDDILVTTGTPGAADFRAFTIDGSRRIGFSHGGFYNPDGSNLINAIYEGWAADQFAELLNAIQAGTQLFSVPGVIDLADLPQSADPEFGVRFGPADVTTAFSWAANAASTSATVTAFLELIPADPALVSLVPPPQSGLFNGVVIREGASDRNVAAIAESEPVRTGFIDTNSIPSQSQFLGELAPNLQSGDENRRLGFIAQGAIAARNDLDVYSFVGASGTEVFLDIDRTGSHLDSVVELIDANGRVLISNNDSILAETDPAALFTATGVNADAAGPLSVVNDRLAGQRITISESITQADPDSELAITVDGSDEAAFISVATFLQDPALAVENALRNTFGTLVGNVDATLARRIDRITDPLTGAITRPGGAFEVELRFEASVFAGRTAPAIAVTTAGIIGSTVTATTTEFLSGSQLQDAFSTNAKDAGLRIVLPGEAGTRNLYHVRVRSSNTRDPLDFATLNNPALVQNGLSTGSYQLQIRLQETDETAGTQIRLTDIRYAVDGLQIIGQPLHSPLLGEDFEAPGDNDSLATAQTLGFFGNAQGGAAGPLQSDRLAQSFGGTISGATDVDWFRFDVNYENLTRGANDPPLYFSTVFDLDYADGFARSDTALYVFNEAGQLIYVGGDSNIADDVPGVASGNNTSDLSRGSAGTNDPFIGAAELVEGTYFVAVSNQSSVPLPLDQFFNPDSANPLFRLEPIESVRRIAEDRIDSFGGGTASAPIVPILFDQNSIVPYSLDDVVLYVNTSTGLNLVNPFTGQNFGSVGSFGNIGQGITEVAFRSNGELFGFSGTLNNDFFYHRIDTGTATLSEPLSTDADIDLFGSTAVVDPATGLVTFTSAAVDEALVVQALSITAFNDTNATRELGFLTGQRQLFDLATTSAGARYNNNILYRFDPADGSTEGTRVPFTNFLTGAGTTPQEIGKINTDRLDDPNFPIGFEVPEAFDLLGIRLAGINGSAGLADGDQFTIESTDPTSGQSVTFEFNSGPAIVAASGNPLQPLVDGQTITIDGDVFEINIGESIAVAPTVSAGSTLNVVGANGQSVRLQFLNTGQRPSSTNVGINLRTATGQSRTAEDLAAEIATQINAVVADVSAIAVAGQVVFDGIVTPAFATTGTGLSVIGNNGLTNPAAFAVNVSPVATSSVLTSALASAIRTAAIDVSVSGDRLTLPRSEDVTFAPAPGSPIAPPLFTSGDVGFVDGNIEIRFRSDESVETIRNRVINAINAVPDASLTNVSAVATPNANNSVRIVGGLVTGAGLSATPPVGTNAFSNNITPGGSLVRGGVRLGGNVTGIEVINNTTMFAVTDRGELYVISNAELRTAGDRGVGQLVDTATDLIGIPFSGLRSGPISFQGGALRQTLFGITASGDIYAFNTAGQLLPIFAGGASMISTGIAGAQGLDFSTLGFNLWHVTGSRGADPGHGINALPNGTRASTPGGSSLAFNFEAGAFNGSFGNALETPTATPRQDGQAVNNTFNLPGGARGAIQSNEFSLEGVASEDEPVLYFNYFLDTDQVDSITNDRDALRVYVVTPDGVEHLVASNNTARGAGEFDDEFDDPAPLGVFDDTIDVQTQQLFDNTGTWRQARVPLSEFAGFSNLSLRIEFSTGGTTDTGSVSLRTRSGADLLHGQAFTIAGETFSVDLASAVSVPSGSDLATLYSDATARATVTINNQVYVLDDGNRVIGADEIAVPLAGGTTGVTDLSTLTAADIAIVLGEVVRVTPPAPLVFGGLNFSDPQDTNPPQPIESGGRNDTLATAQSLPYEGGSITFIGTGQIENDANVGDFNAVASDAALVTANPTDVDLLRLDVVAGTEIDVSLIRNGDFFGRTLSTQIRFFDETGTSLFDSDTPNAGNFVVPFTGTVFIGISGLNNSIYNPVTGANLVAGFSPGPYEATITVRGIESIAIQAAGNLVEFGGLDTITTSPQGLFTVSGDQPVSGVPVELSRFMSASEVAQSVRQALADRFAGGEVAGFPINGSSILIPFAGVGGASPIGNAGPFVDTSTRSGDRFGAGPIGGAQDNAFEGAYLDDFIIGFAERGEAATNSNVVSAPFVTDTRPGFSSPADPTTTTVTGSYQVEIRSASEYVNSLTQTPFRTFDTNQRLTQSRSITARPASELRDGQTFSLFDGRSTIVFEFDQNGVVQPGHVGIEFLLSTPDPITGSLRSQTASEVADAIIAAINRPDVQAIIDSPALSSAGVDAATSPTINLFGEVVIDNNDGALASVTRENLRGDDNRDRAAQGVILIESSRFLFNQEHGIKISHGLTANVNGVDTPSVVRYPRNLVELNTENLRPGVVVQSNILAFNEIGGLQIDGIPLGANDTLGDTVAFDRIVNNTIIGGQITPGRQSPPETFQGTLFAQGITSFADAVVLYEPNNGNAPPAPLFQTSTQALGAPDGTGRGPEPIDGTTTVSLGLGGRLTLRFDDNLLTGSGDSRPDLIVYETGAIESVRVEISRDGVQFQNVGNIGGLTNQIDIDAFGFGVQDRFAFVRLTDLRQGGTTGLSLGADIDAVGAISSVPVETFIAGGVGIDVIGNAAPALLNNVIANSTTGIQTNTANTLPILGANTFFRNTANAPNGVSLGQFSQVLADAEVVFVGAADLVFAPAAGSRIIDSSIDSLQDRASLTTVKNPLGLPPSPILAPSFDVNGQLRIDDPNVETPSGLGERVFRDRGASDRGDLVGPRVVLLSPQAPNLGTSGGSVSVFGDTIPRFFEIQLIDGLAPADVVPGTGIDDRSVSNQSVLLLRDGVALVEGVDYRFGYNPTTNVIRLTPIAGVFEADSTYTIRMTDASDAIVAATDGDQYADGGELRIRDLAGATRVFEYETGILLEVTLGTVVSDSGDGVLLTVFDGINEVIFELDNDGLFDPVNIPVTIPTDGVDAGVAAAIAAAINASPLNLAATTSGTLVQILGPNPLATVTSSTLALQPRGAIGTDIGFGLQVPVDGSAVADTVQDGQTFIVRRGAATAVTFELDNDGVLETVGARPVAIGLNPTLDSIVGAIVRAVGGAGLGLSPENAGSGRVFLGGDATYSLDLTDSTLTQLGIPGDGPTTPIVIPVDLSAAEVAIILAGAINDANLPGVTTSIVDTRVFVEGTGGASGVGAVDLITVRDEVGNLLQSNQANGRTELTIFIGGGFDFGDAPAPYSSQLVQGGPRHGVDPTISLGAIVSPDSDARLPNADDDDGVIVGPARGGFATNVSVDIRQSDPNRTAFYLDAWFDWNANGVFEFAEAVRFGSIGTGRSVIGVGVNNLSINVPAGAAVGETFARFRLSDQDNLGPTGDADVGEVEDIRVVVANNPFQNPVLNQDVNDSGVVTPLDALQIINALDRSGVGGIIRLDVLPLPVNLPIYPDVNGDGRITALDALQVINQLSRLPNTTGGSGELIGEGELIQVASLTSGSTVGFVPIAGGVMASGATLLGDEAIAASQATNLTTVTAPGPKTSVFDAPDVVELDSIVDSIAEDAASIRAEDDDSIGALDRLFAAF